MNDHDEKSAKLTKSFEDLLRAVDLSPGRYPELLDTPVRCSRMWIDDLLDGYEWIRPISFLAAPRLVKTREW